MMVVVVFGLSPKTRVVVVVVVVVVGGGGGGGGGNRGISLFTTFSVNTSIRIASTQPQLRTNFPEIVNRPNNKQMGISEQRLRPGRPATET